MTTPRVLDERLFLGTSSFSSRDWDGVFYPGGTAPADYLAHYATRFRTVEVDATFYRPPSLSTARKWRDALPEGFRLAAKIPRVITHDKTMIGCDDDLGRFLEAMEGLGDRLGPLLLQFPYFSKASGMTVETFMDRLGAFVPTLPDGHRFAIEIRNKGWLTAPLLEVLKSRGVALALIDHPWMPRVDAILESMDPVTADFTYIRWLGDRKGIEQRTTNWDRVIVDRTPEMGTWIPAIRSLLGRGLDVFGYFNNHYAGHAPGSITLFEKAWDAESSPSGP